MSVYRFNKQSGQPYLSELEQMGWQRNDKMLKPRIVAFLVEKLCIDLD